MAETGENIDQITYIVTVNNTTSSDGHVVILGSYLTKEEAEGAIDRHSRLLLYHQGGSLAMYAVPLNDYLVKTVTQNDNEMKDAMKKIKEFDVQAEMLTLADKDVTGHTLQQLGKVINEEINPTHKDSQENNVNIISEPDKQDNTLDNRKTDVDLPIPAAESIDEKSITHDIIPTEIQTLPDRWHFRRTF